MKPKVIIVVLAVVAIGLAIALFAAKKQAEDQRAADLSSIVDFSNQVVNAQSKIGDLNQVNITYSNKLAVSELQSAQFSNDLASTSATLATSQSDLASAQGEITNLNSRLAELEVQNKSLDDRLGALTNQLTNLNAQIADTQEKLAHAEAGNEFLQQELQKQVAQRAELEHKFNDLDQLRQQVRKIKSDLFVARRLQMEKYDNSGKKGAEMLVMRRDNPYTPPATIDANTSLNVEIGSDGSVHVIPPLGVPTNSVAH